MNEHSNRWENLRLGLLSLSIPLLASLIHLAYMRNQGRSMRYIFDNAWIVNACEPMVLAVMCVQATLTFVGLLALRRFLKVRWMGWVLAICFVALWV